MNKQQGSTHVVLVVILVLALITSLGWIFWQNFVHKEPVAKETQLVVVDKSKDTTAARADPYANWKSFTASSGDLVKYPDVEYYMTELNDTTILLGKTEAEKNYNETCTMRGECTSPSFALSVESLPKQSGDTIDTVLNRNGNSYLLTDKPATQVTVDGKSAKAYARTLTTLYDTTYIYNVNIDLGSRVVVLDFQYADVASKALIDKMLSTVKLAD